MPLIENNLFKQEITFIFIYLLIFFTSPKNFLLLKSISKLLPYFMISFDHPFFKTMFRINLYSLYFHFLIRLP